MRASAMNESKPRQSHGRIGSIYYVKRLLPGVLLCVAITLAATALERIEVFFVGQPYLEALVLAILLGVAVRTAWMPGPSWREGITFSAKFVLEFAIVLLGAAVSITMIAALGSLVILGIACIVALAIGTSYFISRFLGLPQRMSILIACGNSICGNSAIAAVAPVIGADGDDIASSISFTAVLGVLVVLLLPFLADWRVEQSGRNRDQAGPCADARARRARAFTVRESRQARARSITSSQTAFQRTCALVYYRVSASSCGPLGGSHS